MESFVIVGCFLFDYLKQYEKQEDGASDAVLL